MAFNARWELEELSQDRGLPLQELLTSFRRDFAEMVTTCDVSRVAVANSANTFVLLDRDGHETIPPPEPGLYSIFSFDCLLYLGEATNLYRRQIKDPDNTADSSKRFSDQGRAILKMALHRGWASAIGLEPLFMQLYPGSTPLGNGATLENRYRVSQFSKSLEGAAGLFAPTLHGAMVERARLLGFVEAAG